jgi:hypothetical protein
MFVPTPENFDAIKSCVAAVNDPERPVLFWIGAGASAWCGLPLWPELATRMYRQFQLKMEYADRVAAQDALEAKRFPKLFSLCKSRNPQLYFQTIMEELKTPDRFRSVYRRFINGLRAIEPTEVVTTNVDQCLEQATDLPSVLHMDIEQVSRLSNPRGYILKLHGSTSSSESLIFTDEDYARLLARRGLLSTLEQLFYSRTVIFIGYGLRDEYIINTLRRTYTERPLFGAGPHFAIVPSDRPDDIKGNVRLIQYDPRPHPDHRACIQIIEELARPNTTVVTDRKGWFIAGYDHPAVRA